MAQASTPGLTRAAGIQVRKARRLPLSGETFHSVGDQVAAADIVARTELPGPVSVLKISHRLGCQPTELQELMTVGEGEAVEVGQTLAESKGFFGFFKSQFKSTVAGTIDSISKVNGQVYVRGAPVPVEVGAYVDGEVVEVLPGEGVVVEATATFVQGIFGVGGETGGPLIFGVEGREESLEPGGVTAGMAGAVVVAGAHLSAATIAKAREVGVAGLVGGALHDQDLRALLGHDIGVAITGNEELGITLVVTEGFGQMPMSISTWDLLREQEGQRASLNGATQIRAGVLRPEIIIPTPGKGVAAAEAERDLLTLDPGRRIVVIRHPWFGRTGSVTKMIVQPQRVESESKVRVLEVRFDDGEVAVVPRANVERIEE